MIPKKMALKLIQELEEKAEGSVRSLKEAEDPMLKWMQRTVEEHPVFQGLPDSVKSLLLVQPKVSNVCGNRRRRRLWRREGGVTVYLYSGENSGYTYARAVKELGGDHRKVVQVDLKNGGKWNMVEGPAYAELMSMAMDGQISSILTSPNCRTR